MGVHMKLAQARVELQKMALNKSGHNKFAGYKYFELGDFMPAINEIFAKTGLCGIVSYGADLASLTITDVDDLSSIVITSPMAEAALKGAHAIQNLGAVETYSRRYLWMTAMEIVEHDALDSSEPIKADNTRPEEVKRETSKPLRIKPLPDPDLTPGALDRVQEIVTDIVIAFEEGRELDCIELFHHQLTDNEEKIAAWNLMTPHSKIRAFLKQNRPQHEKSA